MNTNIIWGTRAWLSIAWLLFIFRFYSVDANGRVWPLETRRIEAVCMKDVPIVEPPTGPPPVGRVRLMVWDWEGRACYVRNVALPEGPDGRWRMTVARAPNGNESAPAAFIIRKGAIVK